MGHQLQELARCETARGFPIANPVQVQSYAKAAARAKANPSRAIVQAASDVSGSSAPAASSSAAPGLAARKSVPGGAHVARSEQHARVLSGGSESEVRQKKKPKTRGGS